MLTHVVIWKYKTEATEGERREHIARLRALAEAVPEVQRLAVGPDVLRLPRSYDTGLAATFRDRAGLEAYTVHPDHVVAADFGRRISDHVASVDFEDEAQVLRTEY